MDLGLRDRVYLVTAGSRGLGFAAASQLVADGARVVLSGRSPEALTEAVQALGGPDHAVPVTADNAAPDTATRLIDAAKDAFGRVDGALISVGGPPAAAFADATDEQWRDSFETVFLGAVRIARTLATELRDGGAIAFVLSGSAREPIPGLAISNGLRPGLAMVAKTLAGEVGPRGIRVLNLLPARIDTDRVKHLDSLAADPTAARAAAVAAIPLRRYGLPEEFGRVAAFALSPAAGYLTGVTIPIDGGALHGI